MPTRVIICVVLAVLAGVALVVVTIQYTEVRATEVVAGFAIEVIGILVTVGFVDLLLDRDRRHERAKMRAWNVISDIDHAVWVWQGGSRRFDINELLTLIELIADKDPRPTSTENLLLRLGDRCQKIVNQKEFGVSSNNAFQSGFEELAKLSYFRDSPLSSANHEIKAYLRNGLTSLLRGVQFHEDASSLQDTRRFEDLRDPSRDSQRFRLTGERATLPKA